MRYVVDSNIHIAYLLEEQENDNETLRYIEFYRSLDLDDILISDFVFTEFESVIFQVVPKRYRLDESRKGALFESAVNYLNSLHSSAQIVPVDEFVLHEGMEIFLKHAQNRYISLADSLLIILAQKEEVKLLSRDKRLVSVAKELGVECYE